MCKRSHETQQFCNNTFYYLHLHLHLHWICLCRWICLCAFHEVQSKKFFFFLSSEHEIIATKPFTFHSYREILNISFDRIQQMFGSSTQSLYTLSKINAFYSLIPLLFTVADAWGRPPSGLLSGNFFDLGSFSQCLNIKRNGRDYRTQYCIGQLKSPSEKMISQLNVPQFVFWWEKKS